MAGIMDALSGMMTDLLGEGGMSKMMEFMGGDVMKNMIAGGTALSNSMQTGDLMDFQKGLATNADNRTQTMFDQDQETAERRRNLDFTA